MKTGIVIAGVVALGLVLVVAAFVLMKEPDHYNNPYYTLTYSESTEERTLSSLFHGDITVSPTGEHTSIMKNLSDIYSLLPTLGHREGVDYLWWDVTIDIYAKPNTVYHIQRVAFLSSAVTDHWYTDEPWLIPSGNYNNYNFSKITYGAITTDNNGRYTLTFSIGVQSDEIMTDVFIYGFGAPRSITKI